MRKLKNNKGFTLVEIIVVLVILAILAAAMIPAMLGYVEESRGKTFADQARVAYNAVQTCATEAAALGNSNADIVAALNAYLKAEEPEGLGSNKAAPICAKVRNLIGSDILTAENTPFIQVALTEGASDGHVTAVWYDSNGTADGGYHVKIDVTAGTTNVEKDTKNAVITDFPSAT